MNFKGINFIIKGMLAGASISVGGYIYLAFGGVVGAVLFSIGLLSVVHFGLLLYTGRIKNTFDSRDDAIALPQILIWNIVGCIAMSLLFFPDANIIEAAQAIVEKRTQFGWLSVLGRGIGCGFIMTVAVAGAQKGNWWPLLIGVPGFILAGFIHSIADAFYISVAWQSITPEVIGKWALVVVGNFIGGIMPLGAKIAAPAQS